MEAKVEAGTRRCESELAYGTQAPSVVMGHSAARLIRAGQRDDQELNHRAKNLHGPRCRSPSLNCVMRIHSLERTEAERLSNGEPGSEELLLQSLGVLTGRAADVRERRACWWAALGAVSSALWVLAMAGRVARPLGHRFHPALDT